MKEQTMNDEKKWPIASDDLRADDALLAGEAPPPRLITTLSEEVTLSDDVRLAEPDKA